MLLLVATTLSCLDVLTTVEALQVVLLLVLETLEMQAEAVILSHAEGVGK